MHMYYGLKWTTKTPSVYRAGCSWPQSNILHRDSEFVQYMCYQQYMVWNWKQNKTYRGQNFLTYNRPKTCNRVKVLWHDQSLPPFETDHCDKKNTQSNIQKSVRKGLSPLWNPWTQKPIIRYTSAQKSTIAVDYPASSRPVWTNKNNSYPIVGNIKPNPSHVGLRTTVHHCHTIRTQSVYCRKSF